jgi:hypothetical protein
MRNREIVLTAILSLLGSAGLSCTALAAGPPTTSVNVVNTPSVNVANTIANPVPVIGTVQDAENPARQAVQQNISFFVNQVASAIIIPAGKIFVLETVSFSVSDPSSTLQSLTLLVTGPLITGGQGQVAYTLVLPPPDSHGIRAGTQALRLYVQPGPNLTPSASTQSLLNTAISVSLSGYFVDAQQPA